MAVSQADLSNNLPLGVQHNSNHQTVQDKNKEIKSNKTTKK